MKVSLNDRCKMRRALAILRAGPAKFGILLSAALFVLTAAVFLMAEPARAQVAPECAAPGGGSEPTWQVNTAIDDMSPCSFRSLLTNARPGDVIVFSPAVFPPANPAVIRLRRLLPQMVQGDLTVDGSGAGVILDGAAVAIPLPGLILASDGNVVSGLRIKGMSFGMSVLGNSNVIGHASPPGGSGLVGAASNVITGSSVDGILIEGNENKIRGNYIGIDESGVPADPNGGNGITIRGDRNVLGGERPGLGNLISGNVNNGILVHESTETEISANIIGTDQPGKEPVPNGGNGIAIIDSSGTEIGDSAGISAGGCSGRCNILSGNTGNGLMISGPDSHTTTVFGNFIGVDQPGLDMVPNQGAGVAITSGAHDNTIGNEVDDGNVISGNGVAGILLSGNGVHSNQIFGNIIGLDAEMGNPAGNQVGIILQDEARSSEIGGSRDNQVNVIAGNVAFGILIQGSGTTENTVIRNYIGLTPTGQHEEYDGFGNGGAGVMISDGAFENTIGVAGAGQPGNFIAHNRNAGLALDQANNNHILGNTIGQNDTGLPLGNANYGVAMINGSFENQVLGNIVANNRNGGVAIFSGAIGNHVGRRVGMKGATSPAEANIIIRNFGTGIYIGGEQTAGNTVAGNRIGTDGNGAANLGNGQTGVFLDDGTSGNRVDGNHIVGALEAAIALRGASENEMVDNLIGRTVDAGGTSLDIGNSKLGVYLLLGASGNVLENNTIVSSGGHGVVVREDAGEPRTISNTITQNEITDNGGQGISLQGGNDGLAPPLITALDDLGGGSWKIAGETCANCVVEVFSDSDYEGAVFETSSRADGDGEFTANPVPLTSDRFMVTATNNQDNTSEFGTSDDLRVFAIEVTQAVQDLNNSVDLVAGKPTYARIHLQSTYREVPASARLMGWRGDVALGDLGPPGGGCAAEITAQINPDRSQLDHALCFRLPMGWVEAGELRLWTQVNGSRDEYQEIDPNDNILEVAGLQFDEKPAAGIALHRVNFREGMTHVGRWDFPTTADATAGVAGYGANDGMAAGDVDGDGADEVLIARVATGQVNVFGRDAANRISFETSFNGDFAAGDGLAVGNLDQDPQIEAAIAHGSDGMVDVWLLAGGNWSLQGSFDGGFTSRAPFAAGNLIAEAGGGVDEIVVGDLANDAVETFQWDGATWTSASSFDFILDGTEDMAVGDVMDGDGIEEIVFGFGGPAFVPMLIFDPDGRRLAELDDPLLNGNRLAVGDVDGDMVAGNPVSEILMGVPGCRCVDVWKWDPGAATWVWASRADRLGSDSTPAFTRDDAMVVADLDGNGLGESISGDESTNQVIAFRKPQAGPWRDIQSPRAHAEYLKSYLMRMFPFSLSNFEVQIDSLDYPMTKGTPNAGEVIEVLKARFRQPDGAAVVGDLPAYGMVYDVAGFMRGLGMGGNGGSRAAAGPTGCTTAANPNCTGTSSFGTGAGRMWDPDGIYGDWYGAHEIGHTLGQTHITGVAGGNTVACANAGANVFIYPNGRIGGPAGAALTPVYGTLPFFGFDIGDPSLGLGLAVYPGATWTDMMTYCPNEWITDSTFENLLQVAVDDPVIAEGQGEAGEDDGLFLTGKFNFTRATGEFGPVFKTTNTRFTQLPSSSSFSLRFEDAAGKILAEYPLNVYVDSDSEEGDDEEVYFEDVMPFATGTAKFSVIENGLSVLSRLVSAGTPQVTLIHPTGGESFDDKVTISWEAADADGGPLDYSVLYSSDGGSSWKYLVTQWHRKSYEVSTDRLPGSTDGRFRVIANDGVNTGQDDSSGNIRIPFQAPVVSVTFPADDSSVAQGQPVILNGNASDPDGQPISRGSYHWTSSIDGNLGVGPEIVTSELSPGSHLIELSVTDAGGLTATDAVRLSVAEPLLLSNPVLRETGLFTDTSGLLGFRSAKSFKKYVEPGKVTGRAITGPVSAVKDSSISVLTAQGEVTLLVDSTTKISAPPDFDLGIGVITTDPPTRVAVLTDRPLLGESGAFVGQTATARSVILVPAVSTRKHRRVVVIEQQVGNLLNYTDSKGKAKTLDATIAQKVEKGADVIVLVQEKPTGNHSERINGVVSAKTVGQRLKRFVDPQTLDPEKSGLGGQLRTLLNQHLDAEVNRLQNTLRRAPESAKTIINDAVKQAQELKKAAPGSGPAAETVIPSEIQIISPAADAEISPGSTININVRISGPGRFASLEFTIDGSSQGRITDVAGFKGMEFIVPSGATTLTIEVSATDSNGNVTTDELIVPVSADFPPVVELDTPGSNAEYTQGDTLSLRAAAKDDSMVVSAEFSVDGKVYPAELRDGFWTAKALLAESTPGSGEVSSSVLPHVFAGTATLAGQPVPDGTVVTAWIQAGLPATSKVTFTAVDDLSQTSSVSTEITVAAKPVQAGRAVAGDGSYSMSVAQLVGPSFRGKTITFRLGESLAAQTAVWMPGDADVLDLSGASGSAR